MDLTTLLVGAVGALWVALSGVVVWGGKYLLEVISQRDATILSLQEKLDKSSDTILAQSQAQEKLIASQQEVIKLLQQTAKGSSTGSSS